VLCSGGWGKFHFFIAISENFEKKLEIFHQSFESTILVKIGEYRFITENSENKIKIWD
jgi:hypothetical protein